MRNHTALLKNALLFIFIFIFLRASFATAQSAKNSMQENNNPSISGLLKWHEVFTYEVKYSFIKLGEIKVEVINNTLYRGEQAWHLRGIIKSAPGIPFVGREENHYHSIFQVVDGAPRELVYWKDNVDEGQMNEERYLYDYDSLNVYVYKNGEMVDTLDLEQPATSGPLMFFFSRLHAGEQISSRTFIYVDEQKGAIDMEYTLKTDEREYKAFENPITTFYAEGEADFKGPFGFGGDFKTWFSDDNLRLPVEAHVKVWLGNVKVRIIDYKKELRNEESSF